MTETKRRYFIPAAPGFWELTYLDAASGGPEATREPVVAWEMIDDGVSGRRTDPSSRMLGSRFQPRHGCSWIARAGTKSWRVD